MCIRDRDYPSTDVAENIMSYMKADRSIQDPIMTNSESVLPVSYTHLRAHETVLDLVCRLLLEKKNQTQSLLKFSNKYNHTNH